MSVIDPSMIGSTSSLLQDAELFLSNIRRPVNVDCRDRNVYSWRSPRANTPVHLEAQLRSDMSTGLLEKFPRLEYEDMKALLYLCEDTTAEDIATYLGVVQKFRRNRIIALSKDAAIPLKFAQTYSRSMWHKFSDELLDAMKDMTDSIYQPNYLTYTKYSPPNSKLKNHPKSQYKGCSIVYTTLALLSILHGEESLFQLEQLRKTENTELTLTDVTNLLQDWSNFQQYPLEWSVSIAK